MPLIVISIIIVVAIRIGFSIYSKKKKRSHLIGNGTKFEVEIIGVAHPNVILKDGEKPQGSHAGSQWHNTSSQNHAERMRRARVKITYIDPHTRQPVLRRVELDRSRFKSLRIVNIALPGTITVSSNNLAVIKHNKTLFDNYRKGIEAKALPSDRKKELLRNAMLAMSYSGKVSNEGSKQDEEGYYILNPPVKAEGYMLDSEVVFMQTDDDLAYLKDWTQDLEQE